MTKSQIIFKRAFDVPLALVGLLLCAIPMVLVALLIKLTSTGSIFYCQTRIGRQGSPFLCIKFRTMRQDSEKYGSITTRSEYRITPLGRILRRYKLDELPQLWNVLTGKMSFVGPRPDVPGYADHLQGTDRRLLDLYPGITGPATLRFRDEEILLSEVADAKSYNDEILYPEKVRVNLAYLDNWSFWKDMGYILITILPGMGHNPWIDRQLGLSSETSSPSPNADDFSNLS